MVYVDACRGLYAQMIADTLPELVEMARAIRARPDAFRRTAPPTFEIDHRQRKAALRLGALAVNRHQMAQHLARLAQEPS